MAITNFDVKVEFDLNDAIPEFVITDENDYAGDSDTLVGGSLSIYDTQGDLLYETESGEELVPSDLVLDGIGIPTDTNGVIVKGTYRVVYQAYTTNLPEGSSTGYNIDKTFDFQFCNPKITITHTEDCFAARFDSKDTTSYAVDGESPFTKLITHVLHKPSELELDPLTNNAELQRITYPDFYEGTYITIITTELTYSYGSGWYINTTVTRTKNSSVVCDVDLCSVYCGVTALKKRVDTDRSVNRVTYIQYRDQLIQVAVLMVLYEQAVKCGGNSVAETYLNEILDIVGRDCNCDDCGTCSSSPDSTGPKQINPFINSVIDNTETNQWHSVTGAPVVGLGNDNDFAFSNNGVAYYKTGGVWNVRVDLNGDDGDDGTSSVWRFGTGIPSSGLGNNSDLYVDDANQDVYFKELGAWTGPIFNTKGPIGATGATGATGADGADGAAGSGSVPVGTVCLYHGGDATQFATDFPGGAGTGSWLGWGYCNGTTYGTITTPDLRGRTVFGYSATLTEQTTEFPKANVISGLLNVGTGGFAEVDLGVNQLPQHNHSVSLDDSEVGTTTGATGHSHGIQIYQGTDTAGGSDRIKGSSKTDNDATYGSFFEAPTHVHSIPVHNHDVNESDVGTGDGHDNIPPYGTLPWIKRVF